jgi:hypothetical protein
MIMPRLDWDSPGSADQEKTAIMPRLARKLADSSGPEQTLPLPVVDTEPPEAPSELTESMK